MASSRPPKRMRLAGTDTVSEILAKSEQYGFPHSSANFVELHAPALCSNCSRFDLENMLIYEYPEIKFGNVPPADTECPFCSLVRKALRLAWGDFVSPEELDHGPEGPLEIFIKSKSWWSKVLPDPPPPPPPDSPSRFDNPVLDQGKLPDYLKASERSILESGKSLDYLHSWMNLRPSLRDNRQYLQPRIVLAVNGTPSEMSSKYSREKPIRKPKDRFVIAEFEAVPLESAAEFITSAFAAGLGDDPRIYRRPIRPKLDVEIIKKWLDSCNTHAHTIATSVNEDASLFSREGGFRLLDVFEECLVQKHEKCDYAALSYVWGEIPDVLQTTRATVRDLSKPKALSASRLRRSSNLKIPRTIVDTMELLRKIGRRYLWVDALCIVQDDAEEKRRLIHGMDRIYENADLTIIAAAGCNADAGLPGITPRTERTFEEPVTINNPEYGYPALPFRIAMGRPSLTEQVRMSCWNSRAWTYQEQCLSRRCLYFTKDEVFFVCNDCHMREGYAQEDIKKDPSEDPWIRTGAAFWDTKIRKDPNPLPYCDFGNIKRPLTFDQYRIVVQEYNKKNLKYSNDIFNAFEGIYNRFNISDNHNSFKIATSQGIPARFLPDALLWFPTKGATRRELHKPKPNFPTTKVCTWSWASWAGEVDFFASRRSGLNKPPPGSEVNIMVLRYHFGGSFPAVWDTSAGQPSRECKASIKKVTDLDFNIFVKQLPARSCAAQGNLLEGEIGFWAVCLSAGTISLSARPHFDIWSLRFPIVEFDSGSFRFDDDDHHHITEFVGITWAGQQGKGSMVVLGVDTDFAGVSRRVGMGTLQFDDLHPRHTRGWRSMPWQWQFIRLR